MKGAKGMVAMVLSAAVCAAGSDGGSEILPTAPADRLVGMAYATWFPPLGWDRVWGTPELGHYRSDDPAVIRQHAEWLSDAGVDFVWIDWSNNVDHDPAMAGQDAIMKDGTRWLACRPDIAALESATEAVFRTYAGLPASPRISIFLGCTGSPESVTDGRLQRKADQVYEQFVADPLYGPLVQRYLEPVLT